MKKLIPLLAITLLFCGCEKDDSINSVTVLDLEVDTRGTKFILCHYSEHSGTYNKLRLPQSAVTNHLAHHQNDRLPGESVELGGTLYRLEADCQLVLALPKDGDGNTYQTIQIGDQEWLTSNLKTTTYNDGSPIPLIENGSTWGNLTSPAYCWQNNTSSNMDPYGALYNFYVAAADNPKNVCPVGWHVPSDSDWNELINYLGGSEIAGGKMKETGTSHWTPPNTGATNISGFTAVAGGNRNTNGQYDEFPLGAFWWSSTPDNSTRAYYIQIGHNSDNAYRYDNLMDIGFSIRCVKN